MKQDIKKLLRGIISENYVDAIYGYKIMKYEDGYAVSMADSRFSFKPEIGKVYGTDRNGIYMSPNKEYVMDYYGGNNDVDILLKFKFDKDNILVGNLSDVEPEIGVRNAELVDFEIIEN